MNQRVRAQRPNTAPEAKRTPQAAATRALSLRAMQAPDVLGVQTSAGNRAARTALQRSMEVGAAGDAHEVEADAVAREIVSGSGPASTQRATEEEELQAKHVQREAEEEELLQSKHVQREAEEDELQMSRVQRASLEEEEPLQAKHVQRAAEEEELQAKHVQREAEEDELQMSRLQRESAPEVGMEGGSVSGETSAMVEQARGGGNPLAPDVRREMEGHFGADFSGVRVHQGGESADLNNRLSARAFTTGSDIFVGQGGLNPGSRGGKELLAHELTHVVQQGAARKMRRKE